MRERVPSVIHSVYKRTLSPMLHAITGMSGACRFQPTCSEYAVLAVSKHGWIRGGWLAIYRVLRCNPLSRGGFEPVPGTWPATESGATESCRVGPRQLP
jgi:putative membrane protein insertion efficiency factor